MKFVDTSVLVSAAQTFDQNHDAALNFVTSLSLADSFTALHVLSEFFSVTTRLPKPWRLSPTDAVEYIGLFQQRLGLVTLTEEEYVAELRSLPSRGIMGGGVHDALIVACARKAKATAIYTYDISDFRHAAPDLSPIIRTP